MNKWDKVKKPTWTKQDNFFAYLKMAGMIALALFYVYLLT
jgi:flagellar biogenesis protein FliO